MNVSNKTKNLTQSGIRNASTRCAAVGGINLGQGVCDLPIEDSIKTACYQAVEFNKSLYSPCEGSYPLREALAHKLNEFNHIQANPETQIMITHGSTGAFVCAVNTLFNPTDEVILFEPFYGYHQNILQLHGLTIKSVPFNLADLTIDFDQLKHAISDKTKGIIICTPCNPCGKVFSKEELLKIGDLARQHNLWLITDEIYEYITYPGYEHVSVASLEDHFTRTITISGFSKTYNMTGWRLGYASGPDPIIEKMALVQDLLYVCPATPLQHAVITALKLPNDYYSQMRQTYLKKRDIVVSALTKMGFKVPKPEGAYYLMADISKLKFPDDMKAADYLLEQAKVAVVPGSSFYANPAKGAHLLRFCYALEEEKIKQALEQIADVL